MRRRWARGCGGVNFIRDGNATRSAAAREMEVRGDLSKLQGIYALFCDTRCCALLLYPGRQFITLPYALHRAAAMLIIATYRATVS